MTVYGYERCSTAEQVCDRQTDELLARGIDPANIYTDKESGGKVHRKALDELLAKLEPGDVLMVLSWDRLSRSVSQLLSISEDFQKRGIELVSIKEGTDTRTPQGKLFFTICAAFAEFERNMNNERTRQGLKAAKNRGAKLGRPKAPQEKLDEAVRLYKKGGMTMKQISNAVGVSISPIYREIKRREQEAFAKRQLGE